MKTMDNQLLDFIRSDVRYLRGRNGGRESKSKAKQRREKTLRKFIDDVFYQLKYECLNQINQRRYDRDINVYLLIRHITKTPRSYFNKRLGNKYYRIARQRASFEAVFRDIDANLLDFRNKNQFNGIVIRNALEWEKTLFEQKVLLNKLLVLPSKINMQKFKECSHLIREPASLERRPWHKKTMASVSSA